MDGRFDTDGSVFDEGRLESEGKLVDEGTADEGSVDNDCSWCRSVEVVESMLTVLDSAPALDSSVEFVALVDINLEIKEARLVRRRAGAGAGEGDGVGTGSGTGTGTGTIKSV